MPSHEHIVTGVACVIFLREFVSFRTTQRDTKSFLRRLKFALHNLWLNVIARKGYQRFRYIRDKLFVLGIIFIPPLMAIIFDVRI